MGMLLMNEELANSHLHRCQSCGTVWGHGNMMAADIAAHECPKCGKKEWRIYKGGGSPVAQMPARRDAKTDWANQLLIGALIAMIVLTIARTAVALFKEARA